MDETKCLWIGIDGGPYLEWPQWWYSLGQYHLCQRRQTKLPNPWGYTTTWWKWKLLFSSQWERGTHIFALMSTLNTFTNVQNQEDFKVCRFAWTLHEHVRTWMRKQQRTHTHTNTHANTRKHTQTDSTTTMTLTGSPNITVYHHISQYITTYHT